MPRPEIESEIVEAGEEKPAVSLSPKGLTLENASRRLNEIADPIDQAKDAEHIMMKLWEEANTRRSFLNMGVVPLDTIFHTCNDKCGTTATRMQMGGTHFYSGELNEHDVQVAAGTVQWLATNVGRAFLDKFLKALTAAHKRAP